jgi:hypothetical protein
VSNLPVCTTEPERWAEPKPEDVAARVLCRRCPQRKSCALEALRLNAEGLWAGVIVPPPGLHQDRGWQHAQKKLIHIAGLL